jgi:hypothetical protein
MQITIKFVAGTKKSGPAAVKSLQRPRRPSKIRHSLRKRDLICSNKLALYEFEIKLQTSFSENLRDSQKGASAESDADSSLGFPNEASGFQGHELSGNNWKRIARRSKTTNRSLPVLRSGLSLSTDSDKKHKSLPIGVNPARLKDIFLM